MPSFINTSKIFNLINIPINYRGAIIEIYEYYVLVFIESTLNAGSYFLLKRAEQERLAVIIKTLFPKPFSGLDLIVKNTDSVCLKKRENVFINNCLKPNFQLSAIFEIDKERYSSHLESILEYIKNGCEMLNKRPDFKEIANKVAFKIFPEQVDRLFLQEN